MNPRTRSILDRAESALEGPAGTFGRFQTRVLVAQLVSEIKALDAENEKLDADAMQATRDRDQEIERGARIDAENVDMRVVVRSALAIVQDLQALAARAQNVGDTLQAFAGSGLTQEEREKLFDRLRDERAEVEKMRDRDAVYGPTILPTDGMKHEEALAKLRANPFRGKVPVVRRNCVPVEGASNQIPTAERGEGGASGSRAVLVEPEEETRARVPEPAPGVSASPADAGRVEPLLDKPVIPSDGEDEDDAPYACPGCLAVGGRCADGCPDAEMERDREERDLFGDAEDENEDDQESWRALANGKDDEAAPGFLRGIAADLDEDDGRTP